MKIEKQESTGSSGGNERRKFLKQAGKAALGVPVASLLLSASAKPSRASGGYGKAKKSKKSAKSAKSTKDKKDK